MKLREIFGFMALCLFVTARETAAQNCQSTTLTFGDCESKNLKGQDYTGNEAKTKKGLTCQKWTSQSPHRHGYAKFGDHNYCRNTDGGEPHLWCYTTSSSKRWDFCDVPICDKSVETKKMNETYTACMKNPECEGCIDTIKRLLPLLEQANLCEETELSFSDCESNTMKGKDYTGKVAKTKSGLTCQKWTSQSPHKHKLAKTGDHNFCRNPDGEPHVWCYTTSSSKRWELCDVPICDKSLEYMKKKTAYTRCIKTPACDGCKNIFQKSLPFLIRENVIKEGEIGVNDGSNFKGYGAWDKTLTLLKGNDIITKRTKDEQVTINGTVNGYVGGKRWYGGSEMRYRPTGLYAGPGDMVTITFPEKLSGKVGVNIGHYEYKIWFPQMQKSVFKIGSPWGGLIVLWLTKKDAIKGEFTITIDNAIKAPTYILGSTTNQQWNKEIRHYSPKWAVLRVPGQANIYVQTLKIKNITDMEASMTKIKKSMDVVERMIDLPEGSQPGAEIILFYPGMGGGYHHGLCTAGTTVCGDSVYPLKKGKEDTYYDNFFKTLGTNGLVGHELGHGYCYSDTPNMGNQWTAETVASYQRWRMGNPDVHSLKTSWWMNSTNLDFYLLDRMVSFALYSDGKPCGEAKFANNKQLYEGAYDKCWKWLNWIPQRLHGWQVWDKFNALDAKSTTKYKKRGNMKDYLEGWMFRQDLNAHDRMVDLYCQATGYNMLPLFDLYNINKLNKLSPTVINNCVKLPESNILTEWLDVTKCVKQSMNGMKEITDCEDMPRFPSHEGLCLLNGVCRKDKANGGTTEMKNRFDLKGTYKDWDLPAHSEETCLKRAKVFFVDCQNEDSQTVTATWVTKDGNSKHSKFPRHHKGNCYNDRSPRLMPKYQGGMSTMTPEVCNKKCLAKHFTHFGVQYSKECWCGNEAPHISKKVDPNECDDMCTGDTTRRCGGGYRANIWKVCPGQNCLFEYE